MNDIDEILLSDSCSSEDTSHADSKAAYRFFKRFFDVFLSVLLFIVLLPFNLLVSLLIVVLDGHKPIYKSERIGLNGKPFKIYKFQTMKPTDKDLSELLSPDEYAAFKQNYKLDRDPRVTRLGRILRKTSIDEIPQLINIIKGDMSLVGPRPVLYEETELYGENRDLLLSVRPGLTGLWQASGRNNIDYASGKRQKVELYYVEHCSFLLDIKIILMTFKAAVTMNGAM